MAPFFTATVRIPSGLPTIQELSQRWDSQEHAASAAAVISPRLEQHLAGNVTGPPDRRLFPVIAS